MSLPRAPGRLSDFLGAQPYTPRTSAEGDERFLKAILVSILVHFLFIFGMQFKAANPRLFENPNPPLEVVLVNARSKVAPLKVDVLAQASLDGGGNVDQDRHVRTPLPVSERRAPVPASAHVQTPERAEPTRLHQAKSTYTLPEPVPQAQPAAPEVAQDLTSRALAMAELQARIDTQMDEYQKRPRRLFLGARAREYSFAQYVDDWRQKVERVGNLNYPEAARRNHIYGSLVLVVNIRADGTLESVQVDRSSGYKILDAAAVKIVEMASPFSPFPENIRRQADILVIPRTWSFTRSDQISSP